MIFFFPKCEWCAWEWKLLFLFQNPSFFIHFISNYRLFMMNNIWWNITFFCDNMMTQTGSGGQEGSPVIGPVRQNKLFIPWRDTWLMYLIRSPSYTLDTIWQKSALLHIPDFYFYDFIDFNVYYSMFWHLFHFVVSETVCLNSAVLAKNIPNFKYSFWVLPG